MGIPPDPNQTVDAPGAGSLATVAYRCSCGMDVLVASGGEGVCDSCGRKVDLGGLNASQTVSFCAERDHDTGFQLADGPDRSGESLSHFRLMSKLGYGGMGAVYRALDESLQRFVAVKVIRSADEGQGISNKLVNRLLDEAVLQARLNHPNVVTIYYVGRDGKEPFFAMELLPGPTLSQMIDDGPLAYGEVVRYARQICSALAQATRLGLVHGDIKPGNLIMAGDGIVKLSDFGLAKTKQSGPSKGVSGTLNYMAPELSDDGEPSAQSDMYSLGVTLFELTFGRRPYAIFGTTLREQLESQRNAAIDFPTKWPATLPLRWRDVLQRLLAQDPADRYASYEELDEDLVRHAPVGFTTAGLLSRSMALATDYALLGLLMLPFIVPWQLSSTALADRNFPEFFRTYATQFALLPFFTPLVPALATWFEWIGWRSPGRYLFQLRVVDAHGLRLERKKRVLRSVMRNITIWIASLTPVALVMGFDFAAIILSPVDELILLINTIPVLGPTRRAIHDRLFGSHVILATRDSK